MKNFHFWKKENEKGKKPEKICTSHSGTVSKVSRKTKPGIPRNSVQRRKGRPHANTNPFTNDRIAVGKNVGKEDPRTSRREAQRKKKQERGGRKKTT